MPGTYRNAESFKVVYRGRPGTLDHLLVGSGLIENMYRRYLCRRTSTASVK